MIVNHDHDMTPTEWKEGREIGKMFREWILYINSWIPNWMSFVVCMLFPSVVSTLLSFCSSNRFVLLKTTPRFTPRSLSFVWHFLDFVSFCLTGYKIYGCLSDTKTIEYVSLYLRWDKNASRQECLILVLLETHITKYGETRKWKLHYIFSIICMTGSVHDDQKFCEYFFKTNFAEKK